MRFEKVLIIALLDIVAALSFGVGLGFLYVCLFSYLFYFVVRVLVFFRPLVASWTFLFGCCFDCFGAFVFTKLLVVALLDIVLALSFGVGFPCFCVYFSYLLYFEVKVVCLFSVLSLRVGLCYLVAVFIVLGNWRSRFPSSALSFGAGHF